MKPITIWYRYDDFGGAFKYNHFNDGWTENIEPTPYSDEQLSSWRNAKWKPERGYITSSGKVVSAVTNETAEQIKDMLDEATLSYDDEEIDYLLSKLEEVGNE